MTAKSKAVPIQGREPLMHPADQCFSQRSTAFAESDRLQLFGQLCLQGKIPAPHGKLFLYVGSSGILFALRPKLRSIKKLLSGLPTAPKRFTVHLEIKAGRPAVIHPGSLAGGKR